VTFVQFKLGQVPLPPSQVKSSAFEAVVASNTITGIAATIDLEVPDRTSVVMFPLLNDPAAGSATLGMPSENWINRFAPRERQYRKCLV
jgi:hypothetical protein